MSALLGFVMKSQRPVFKIKRLAKNAFLSDVEKTVVNKNDYCPFDIIWKDVFRFAFYFK